MFRTIRRIRRIERLISGSPFPVKPVMIAGVCGVIGVAALLYLKKKSGISFGLREKCCDLAGFKHGGKCCCGAKKEMPPEDVYTADDFVVNDEDAGSKRKPSSKKAAESSTSAGKQTASTAGIWIASSTSKTFHKPDCSRIGRISEKNRIELKGSTQSLIEKGYKPCAACIGK